MVLSIVRSDCNDDVYCEDLRSSDIVDVTGQSVYLSDNEGQEDLLQGQCSSSLKQEEKSGSDSSCDRNLFSIENSAYDTVLYIKDDCVGEELVCNDDADFFTGEYNSLIEELFLVEGQSIAIVVDDANEFAHNLDIIPTFESM